MSETNTAPETRNFGAEVGRLLDLVVHSLYSDREIFLRELVANAADATDKRRFLALSDESLALPETPAIRIALDKTARTITITDHGTGMSKEELAIIWKLRRVLSGLDGQQALELLLERLKKSQNNLEFLMQVQKTTPTAGNKDD